MDKLNKLIENTQKQMEASLSHLEKVFSEIRAGKASPILLEGIKVDYYGSMTPLNQVANISVLDAMTLNIQVYEKAMFAPIERAIINSNLGLTPTNNGESIQIRLPILTEESRKDLVKRAKAELESTKVSIRNIRKESNGYVKKIEDIAEDLIKSTETRIQKITDEFIKKADDHFFIKEKEILKV